MTIWQWLVLFVVCAGFGVAWYEAGKMDKWQ